MKLAGGLFPHPPIIIPEVGGQKRFEAEKTIDATRDLAREMSEADPQLIIFSGPHGQARGKEVTLLQKERLSGDFSQFNTPEVELSVESLPEKISELIDTARSEGWAVSSLDDPVSAQLDHGVLVPLYFLREAGLSQDIPWIITNVAFWSPEKLFGFGQFLDEFFGDKDVLFVCSGDLSHRLKPGAPGGYDPDGEKFDRKLMELLEQERIHDIIDLDSKLRENAGECGYRPLLIALGFCQNENLNIEVKSYQGPFGVGYGVAGFYN